MSMFNDFKEWLKEASAVEDVSYDFMSMSDCLVARYFAAKGTPKIMYGKIETLATYTDVFTETAPDYDRKIKNYHMVCNPEGEGKNQKKIDQDKKRKMTYRQALARVETL
jgi:hypothetical protein